ncbi:alpha/beta hydrolase [Rhizobium deserti]|uniref:Alpha/beta hydrolase n=1 Tax=Rhizobium deserti TaxID=2547961 RepID=A0A4R5UB12_9HYPH|nr:alpha/beta hydrolase [Rhizobium deserti]TDK32238.1 alpha/beta hydrolase [Rhizobium deserti]
MRHKIIDWDDAYANGINIPQGDRWPVTWVEPARIYRERMGLAGQAKLGLSYGDRPRNRFDLFMPKTEPLGLVVFVHGGFWIRLDNSYWSHLAQGAVEAGYAVAIPSYTLAPEMRISGITQEVGRAIETAAEIVGGPIRLAGHSAGGQLVTRMVSTTSPLSPEIRDRIVKVVSISGVHDLRPLLNTQMNEKQRIDVEEAYRESPALLEPLPECRLTCWVGAAERSEFIRQNALLANIWKGLGAETECVEEPDRHHFNALDGLLDPHHPLTEALLS